MANLALGNEYGIDGKPRASRPVGITQKDSKLIIKFDCQDGERILVKPKTNEIEISADNITYYPAKVIANGCSITVSSNKVPKPKYVRHAWTDTGTGSLMNEENEAICTFLVTTEQ